MVRHGIETSKSVSGPSGVPGLLSWFPITGKVIRGNLQAVVSHLKHLGFGRNFHAVGSKERNFTFKKSALQVSILNVSLKFYFSVLSQCRWKTKQEVNQY